MERRTWSWWHRTVAGAVVGLACGLLYIAVASLVASPRVVWVVVVSAGTAAVTHLALVRRG